MCSILATTKSSWRNRKQQCSKFGVQNWFIHDWIFYKNCYCFCHIAIENFIGYADICHCSVPWNYSTQVRGHSATKEWLKMKMTKLWMGYFMTISCHFFTNYNNNFHKTEDLKVILVCPIYKNINWIKSYDINNNFCFVSVFSIL